MRKILKLIGKIVGILVSTSLILILVLFSIFNVFKFVYFNDFYSIKQNIATNPGLNDGFVCQGIAQVDLEEYKDYFLVSGYMSNNELPSRIYLTNLNNESYYVSLYDSDDSIVNDHLGSVISINDNIYALGDDRLYKLSFTDLISKKENGNGSILKVIDSYIFESDFLPAFMYTDNTNVYIGEFYDGDKYDIVGHEQTKNDVTNHGYLYKYGLINNSFGIDMNILKTYSIPDKAQGCIIKDGYLYLCTSYGISDSYIKIYDIKNDLNTSDITFIGEDNLVKSLKCPPMLESLDLYNDEYIITISESSSNKYLFGKLFFCNYIYALDNNKLLEDLA